jgi:hypothetical protein
LNNQRLAEMKKETKKSLKEKCQKILHSYNGVVTSKEDFDFLMEVFKCHTEWEEKCKGQKIIRIEVGPAPGRPSKCFFIVREDGSKTDISYTHCINARTNDVQIKNACRNAIYPQIRDMKAKIKLPFVCPLSNMVVDSMDKVHIDHYDLDFNEVVEEWLKDKDKQAIFDNINKTEDNNTLTFFTSPEIVQDFIQFHNAHTHLRALSCQANLTRKRKK